MQILLIPGLLCTNQVWGNLNCLRTSYPCFDANLLYQTSISDMSASLTDYLENISDRLVVVGVSMGGYVAIDFALRNQEKVEKLILINTTAEAVSQESIPDRLKGIALAKRGKFNEMLSLSEGKCFYRSNHLLENLLKEMALEIGPEVYIQQQTAIINRQSYVSELYRIKAKTCIITSKEDKVISYKDSIVMAKKIEKSELILLDECGHLSLLEKGSDVENAVTQFLKV